LHYKHLGFPPKTMFKFNIGSDGGSTEYNRLRPSIRFVCCQSLRLFVLRFLRCLELSAVLLPTTAWGRWLYCVWGALCGVFWTAVCASYVIQSCARVMYRVGCPFSSWGATALPVWNWRCLSL